MNDIEQKITLFLEAACEGKAAFSEEVIKEFGERCENILRKGFIETPPEEKKFTLRMSNIGRSIRQLMLAKASGGAYKPNKDAKVKFTIGHMAEAFLLAVLKQSGVNVIDHDKQVMLPVGDTKIYGTYDVKISSSTGTGHDGKTTITEDKIYDIKTASPYAFDNKFCSIEALKSGDSFGYFAQGFGYALADKSKFGGWIALNKVTGEIAVLDIPKLEHDTLQKEYAKQISDTVAYVNSDKDIPPCCGVVDEYFSKKPTGNRILDKDCEWCEYKFNCHSTLQAAPEAFSKAATRRIRYYIGKITTPKDK